MKTTSSVSGARAVLYRPDGAELPPDVEGWLSQQSVALSSIGLADELMAMALRSRPRFVLFDGRLAPARALEACTRLKKDSYTGVVPAVFLCADDAKALANAFGAGADEVITVDLPGHAVRLRMDAFLARSDRDLGVHPSTRLPGAGAIEAEIKRLLAVEDLFAVCYADLDHFKEFNDRYSYNQGDRVIRILAMILHDVVKGTAGEAGFVGHIGGDDFIFIIPPTEVPDVCGEIISTFDELIPYQYSETDRRVGYFFGKDRRGVLDRVPLMTLSIGVVTNAQRSIKEARQISQLATEMKTYAKSLPGSVYTVDRRTDERPPVHDTRHPSIHDAAGDEE
ncbi:MAG: diguanylate cyclase [Gemmatimonadota bacterium]|nr:diguanylate cyclase [Gemmatimonadota bacterium]